MDVPFEIGPHINAKNAQRKMKNEPSFGFSAHPPKQANHQHPASEMT